MKNFLCAVVVLIAFVPLPLLPPPVQHYTHNRGGRLEVTGNSIVMTYNSGYHDWYGTGTKDGSVYVIEWTYDGRHIGTGVYQINGHCFEGSYFHDGNRSGVADLYDLHSKE